MKNIGMTKTTIENLLPLETQEKLLKLKVMYEPSNKAQKASQQSFTSPEATKLSFRPKELSLIDKENQRKSRERFQEAKAWFESTFPKSFNFKKPKPLKVGIQHDLFLASSPFSKRLLCKVLKSYTHSKVYLEAIARENWRYDLNGERFEEITPGQKDHALQMLAHKKSLLEKNKKTKFFRSKP